MFPTGKECALLALFVATAGWAVITGLVKLGAWVAEHVEWVP